MSRGKAKKTLHLIDAAYKILAEIQPATVRAVCYRLFVAGLILNMGKSCTNSVSRILTRARETGDIPWEWIVDESREAEYIRQWSNTDALIAAAVRQYRRNYWQDQAIGHGVVTPTPHRVLKAIVHEQQLSITAHRDLTDCSGEIGGRGGTQRQRKGVQKGFQELLRNGFANRCPDWCPRRLVTLRECSRPDATGHCTCAHVLAPDKHGAVPEKAPTWHNLGSKYFDLWRNYD